MIDWIKAVIPCRHSKLISGGVIIALNDESGAVDWETRRRRAVEGSHSSKVYVTSVDESHILVDGNPSKFLQGHNVFGTNELPGLCEAFFARVCRQLEVETTLSDRRAWRRGEYRLRRVDVAESFRLGSQTEVAAWLRAAAPAVRGKHQAASAYAGETLYLGQHSRRISLKAYNKWRELQKHRIAPTVPEYRRIEEYAKPLLRVEVRLLGMELQRRELYKGEHWTDPEIGPALIAERVATMKLNEKARLSSEDLADLPPRLLAVYKLWKQGEDLRAL